MRAFTTSLTPWALILGTVGCSTPAEQSPDTGGSGGSSPMSSGGSSSGTTATGGRMSGGSGGAMTTGGATAMAGSTAGGGAPNGGSSGAGGAGNASGGGGAGAAGAPPAGGAGAGGSSGGVAGSGGDAGSVSAGAGGSSGGVAGSAGTSSGPTHWVGTWTASPYLAASDAQPPMALSNAVLRQVAHVSLGGSQLRFQFSNKVGNGAVTINSAHIAICKATPLVDSTIDVATDKALAFSGMASVTLAQGMEVWSDPIDFAVAPLGNISITTALGSVPSSLTAHAGSRTTSYIAAGSDVSVATMASAQKTDHWYFISGIDVMAPEAAVGVVAIGDSITDGRGTDTNGNNRWTDILAARLHDNAATVNVAVMNQGIGATNLIGSGTAAEARFARDVLGQSGVKYAIIYDGVNDIAGGASFSSMKTVYDKLIAAGHAEGLLVYGGTITPFSGNSYYSTGHESVRQQVNTYVKSGAFDGYIDFDAAVTDGGNPPALQAAYAAWSQEDWLHPGPAGYKKMGEAADLTLFTK